ncbi:hypothetical protein [Geopseudomonas aromaticivorans]
MRYALYRSNTRALLKHLQQLGAKVRKGDTRGNLKMLDETYLKMARSMGQTPEEAVVSVSGRILLRERQWITEGQRRTVFLDTPKLVNNLLLARFSHEGLPCPDVPQTFAIALPEGLSHAGVPLTPCLVTLGKAIDIAEQQAQMAHRLWKIDGDAGTEIDPQSLAIMLSMPGQDDQGRPDDSYLSLFVGGDLISGLLDADLGDDIESVIPALAKRLSLDVSAHERRLQLIMSRLALALWIYWSAVPEAIVDGAPKGMQDGDAPALGRMVALQASNYSSASGPAGTSPDEHHRRWHFRQLRHDKFYRGDFEKMARGSRWVPVSRAWVNREDGEDLTATLQ